MKIRVQNLTSSTASLIVPGEDGRPVQRIFKPGEIFDLAPSIGPYILDTAAGQELKRLASLVPPKVQVLIDPEDDDFSFGISSPTRAESTPISWMPFTPSTPSPQILRTLSAGDIIALAAIDISVPFNGYGASVSVGTSANPSMFLYLASDALTRLGQYEGDQKFLIQQNDQLLLTINPGSSTQGQANVFFSS